MREQDSSCRGSGSCGWRGTKIGKPRGRYLHLWGPALETAGEQVVQRQTLGVGKGAQGAAYLRRAPEPAEGRRDGPSPALGAASLHTRAESPAATQGTGPHLQARDQGLESGRRAAQTCPEGRHRGALGGSRGKISSAWGSAGEEGGPGQTQSAAREDLGGGGKRRATRGPKSFSHARSEPRYPSLQESIIARSISGSVLGALLSSISSNLDGCINSHFADD